MEQRRHIAVLGLRGIPDLQGGIEQHCEHLYTTIDQKRFVISLLARKPYVGTQPYTHRGIRIIPIWAPRMACVETIVHTFLGVVWILLRRHTFDLVHLHGIGPAVFAPLIKGCGLKVMVTVHGLDYQRSKFNGLGRALLWLGEYLGATFADRVITVSQHLAEHLGRHYPGTPIRYIPNGIQAPEGRPSPAALAPFNLTPGRYVLAVGRIDPGKGFHDLIHAFRKIDTAWKLVIVGGCEHANAYSRSLASLAKADRRIVLTGFQRRDSLQALYAHAGLFVLPSYHEGLPIVALEAISFGLPILLSDIPANREVAETFELFPPGNPHRLQSAIEAFLTNSSSGTITGTYRRRQARIVARFSWPGVSAATADAYRDVLRAA